MQASKHPQVEDEAAESTLGFPSTNKLHTETMDHSKANGYGVDEDEMAWASTDEKIWKGKGLSDEIKTVEVRMPFFSLVFRYTC